MKKFRNVLFFLIFSVFVQSISVMAAEPLDEIEQEVIWIEVQKDGSMYITYELNWKVLDSTSEGPLSWVKIGIPNEYVEELKALSGSIEKIQYYRSRGDYVRLDLNREYEAGETVKLKFSIHQHRMYEETSENYSYHFTPGWFDDISVKELKIYWAYDEGVSSDMEFISEEEGYLGAYYDLMPAERVHVSVSYPVSSYTFDDDYRKSAVSVWRRILLVSAIICGVLGPVVCAVILYGRRNHEGIKDNYEKNRGLGSVYVRPGRGGRGHGCACACACACAGGGRAGCSRKEFFYVRMKKSRAHERDE